MEARKIKDNDFELVEKKQSFVIGFLLGIVLALCFFTIPTASADFTESDLPITVTTETEIFSSFDKTAYNSANSVYFSDILITRADATWYIVNVYYINPDTTYTPFAYLDSGNVVVNRDEVFYTFDTNSSGSDPTNWNYTFTTSYYSGTSGTTSFADATTDILYSSFNIYSDSSGSSIYYEADGGSTELPSSWLQPFGWSDDDESVFYIKAPYYSYVDSYTPRFSFDDFENPEINFGFDTYNCFGTLALEGEEGESCDPYEFTFELYQDTTLLETFDVITGQSYLSDNGYLLWNYPDTATQSPYSLDFFLTETPLTDITYTLLAYDSDSVEIAGIDFVVGENLFVENYDYDSAVSYICDDMDNLILPLDDLCRLIIPEPDYLPEKFSQTYANFIDKFYFIQQISDIIYYGGELFTPDPEIPDNITFTFQGNTYTFLNFSYIDDYADDLRNYTGLIMWCITILYSLIVVYSLFVPGPSKEDII